MKTMNEEEIKEMCEYHFSTHKATLIQNTDRYLIIDWRKADGSSEHYVNYIVDKKRGSLIVSGDLGDSIATWYNSVKASELKKWIKNDIEYYISKFQCSSDIYRYDSEDIINDIKEELKEFDVSDLIKKYNKHGSYYADTEEELWENIEDEISSCIYDRDKFILSEEMQSFFGGLDDCYWEWIYDCGKRICPRVYLWAEGFYLACNQLGI